jgi:hypothetical protein
VTEEAREHGSTNSHCGSGSVSGGAILLKPHILVINPSAPEFWFQETVGHIEVPSWVYSRGNPIFLKKVRTNDANLTNSTPNPHFRAVQQTFMHFMGIFGAQYRKFCFLLNI